MDQQHQPVSSFIAISSTRLTGPDNHAEYEISFKAKPTTWRRYREFDDFAKTLKKNGITVPIPLPPKRLFAGNSADVILERKNGLTIWLRRLLEITSTNSSAAGIVKDFIVCDPWAEDLVQNSSSGNGTSNANKISLSSSSSNGGNQGLPSKTPKEDSKLQEIINRFISSTSLSSPISLPKVTLKLSRDDSEETQQQQEEDETLLDSFKRRLYCATMVRLLYRCILSHDNLFVWSCLLFKTACTLGGLAQFRSSIIQGNLDHEEPSRISCS